MTKIVKAVSAAGAALMVTAGLLATAPSASAASNPGAVTVDMDFDANFPYPCTVTATSVRMNPGNSFTLHNYSVRGINGLTLPYSVDGGGTQILGLDSSVGISFSALGSHTVAFPGTRCATITVSVVSEPVAAPPAHDYFQQVGVPASGNCRDVPAPVGHWAGYPIGGWSKSWAQWINGGRGGPVCTREVEERPDGTIVLIG